MLKNLLFAATFLSTGLLSAQITLNHSTHVPLIGTSYDYYQSQSFTYHAGAGGANQTWDLSGISGTLITSNYISLSSASSPSDFPDANLVESISIAENYYRSNSSEHSLEGQYIPNVVRLTFSDRRELLKFPLNYQDSHSETFAGTLENLGAGQNFQRSGTSTITADGYGDLILPYGTVNNVLRVTGVFDYGDVFMGTPFFNYIDTICFWYNPGTNNFIASTVVTYANGSLALTSGTYIDQADLSTSGVSLVENPQLKEQLSFAPNPASNSINVLNESLESAQVELIDFSGALYYSTEVEVGKTEINTSQLNAGVYLVRYIQHGQILTQKLVIQ